VCRENPADEDDGKYDSRIELERVKNVLKEYTYNIDSNLKEVV
jgi:hypothetical protein